MLAEAACAAIIRTARDVVSDFGQSETAAKSEGLLEVSKRAPTNGERDCQRLMAKKYRLALPIPKTFVDSKDPSLKVPFLRLRDWMNFLLENNCMHILAGLVRPHATREGDIWEAWWKKFQVHFPEHPIFEKARDGRIKLRNCVALLLHGDEGRSKKKNAFLVLNVHSPLGRGVATGLENATKRKYLKMLPNFVGHSYTNRFLVSAMPKSSYTGKNSYMFDRLMHQTAEELQFMADTGVEYQGERYFGFLVGIVGDWPWLAKSGSLERTFMNVPKHAVNHQECKGVCHLCLAGRPTWPFEQLETRHPTWLGSVLAQPPFDEGSNPFRILPHISGELPTLWKFDLFHSIHLGIAKNYLGSMLALFSELEPAGNVDARFELLSSKYLAWCAANQRTAHCQKITKEHLNWTSTTMYPTAGWHKGDLSTSLLLFCEARWRAEGGSWDDEMLRLGGEAAAALNQCLKILYHGEAWLTEHDAWQAGELGLKFLRRYGRLARIAHGLGRKLWVVMPKAHACHHLFLDLLRGSQRGPTWNPITLSVQQDEDFIGRGSRLSRHVSHKVVAVRTVDRYLMSAYAEFMAAGYLVGTKG